ncbi:MAG: hypothetical protein KatS3mg062_0913 [Tepidiforma sp.]|nr:MAG: hypothetical protein KatS3mg062_0913 [Tepidiforma sp.]
MPPPVAVPGLAASLQVTLSVPAVEPSRTTATLKVCVPLFPSVTLELADWNEYFAGPSSSTIVTVALAVPTLLPGGTLIVTLNVSFPSFAVSSIVEIGNENVLLPGTVKMYELIPGSK